MDHLPELHVTLVFVGVALGLVILNGFFVAAEFAIVKVRRTRLEELAGQGTAAARTSLMLVDHMDEYLSATQLGITLVSLALGWIGEEGFYNLFRLILPTLPHAGPRAYHWVATGVSFFVITLLHVVMGELVPKSMAIQRAERITLVVARPLAAFYGLARPLIRTFTGLAALVLRALGFSNDGEAPLSEAELKLVMKESREDGVISESEAQIIARAFEFSDKRVSDIMIPREKVQYLSLNQSLEDNIRVTRRRMYTRFPLTRANLDDIIGTVHMKDAWLEIVRERSNQAFVKTARPPVFVAPTTPQDKLLKLFKDTHTHLAVVQDPATKITLGVVTIEDVLEELVGDIRDEHGN